MSVDMSIDQEEHLVEINHHCPNDPNIKGIKLIII